MARSDSEELDDHLDALGLAVLANREAVPSVVVDRLVARVDELAQQPRAGGKQLLGLTIAFVVVAERALERLGVEAVDDALTKFDWERTNAQGAPVNTLNLIVGAGAPIRLRGIYEKIRDVARNDVRRYDYPNSAPHATQAWSGHREVLEEVFRITPGERRALVEGVWDLLLSLPAQRARSAADAQPRPFEVLLALFPGTQRGEPPGAILQGLAFAYYRADSPTVTISTGKAKAGSRRTGRVGDVDGWDGDQLALSIEVKDMDLTNGDHADLGAFVANLAAFPDARAIVVARSAMPDTVEFLAAQNVRFFDRLEMLRSVTYWDLGKQKLAVREFLHYLVHIEQNGKLIDRFRTFAEASLSDQGA